MWEILDISIPAVVLIPLIAIGVVVWVCLQQNARSSDVRRAEFQRLRRLAMEEHERAERELEQEYMRHKPVDSQGVDFPTRRRIPPGNGYGNDRVDVGLGEWRDPHEGEARRRKQVEDEEHRRKQGEAAFNRRRLADEEDRRKQATAIQEAEFNRRKQAAAEELRAEIEDRKRREAEDEIRRRQTEEQDWQKRRADLEAQARREAEEERRRQAAAEEEERQRRWKQEEAQRQEAQKQDALNFSPRKVHPSSLTCVVCQKPTIGRRRCSRCKSMNYCSRDCQVQHWSDGHKLECRPADTNASPRSSVDGDTRNYSDFNSPRSNK